MDTKRHGHGFSDLHKSTEAAAGHDDGRHGALGGRHQARCALRRGHRRRSGSGSYDDGGRKVRPRRCASQRFLQQRQPAPAGAAAAQPEAASASRALDPSTGGCPRPGTPLSSFSLSLHVCLLLYSSTQTNKVPPTGTTRWPWKHSSSTRALCWQIPGGNSVNYLTLS